MNIELNATPVVSHAVNAILPSETVKRGRGRPPLAVTVKSLRAEIKALGAKPYGADCLKLNKKELEAYVANLRAQKAAH